MKHTIWNNVRFLTLDGPKFNKVIWRALRADVHKLNEQFYSKTFSKIHDESFYFSKFRSDHGLILSKRKLKKLNKQQISTSELLNKNVDEESPLNF